MLDFTGAAQWISTVTGNLGASPNETGLGVASDGTDIFITGTSASDTWTFSGGPTIPNTSVNNLDIWICSYTITTGTFNWAQQIGGVGNDLAPGIAADLNGVYLCGGASEGSVNFPGIGAIASSGSEMDIFSCKLFRATGLTDWQVFEASSSPFDSYGSDVSTNGSGELFICGSFEGITAFDSGSSTEISAGASDAFVLSRSDAGAFNWVQVAGGIGFDDAYGVDYDDITGIHVGGQHQDAITLGTITLTNAAGENGFSARMSVCDPSFFFSAAEYCQEDIDPVPTITGDPGGVFSGPVAVVFISTATGEIDLSASTAGGPYSIVYTVSGCSQSFNLTINAEDDPSFSYSDTLFCLTHADPVPTITGTGGGIFTGPAEVIFTSASTGQIDMVSSTPGGPYIITYTTPGPDCPNDTTFELYINTIDDPGFNYDSPFCTTDSPNPLPTFVTTPGGTFNEVTSGIVFANSTTGEIDMGLSAVGVYAVEYVTSGVCPDSTELNVTINDLPNTIFWLPDTICLPAGPINMNDSTMFTGGETNSFYSYGSGGPAVLSGTDNEFLEPFSSGPGTYNVVQIVDNGGCIDSLVLTLTILAEYNSLNNLPDTICEKDGLINLNTYFESFTTVGGIWTGSTIFNDSLWDISGLGGTLNNISYIVGVGICTDTTMTQVYVGFDVDPAWTPPPQMCNSDSLFNLNTLISGTAGGIFSGFGVTSGGSFDPIITGPGAHNVLYTVGEGVCAETMTQALVVLEDPIAGAGADQNVCGLQVQLSATSNLGAGIWSATNAIIVDVADPSSNATSGDFGLQWFYWTVDQSGICVHIDSVLLGFYDIPTSEAGPDQELYFIFESDMNAVNPTIGSGQWSTITGDGSVDDELDPWSHVSNLSPGENEFEWIVSNGPCPEAKSEILIYVHDIFIPQAVTPNGDGKNDYFEIKGIENYINTVQIFNRWGQLIYETSDYQNDWGATDQSGKILNEDTYYYTISIENQKRYKGFIVVKK
ncbi:gliding motility-associated C-terminal domain-containing protein [Crocinitomix catalasitica]|nr:gliding motility-associated C-terminal domain-containing protein [Crocinitomix catalasitica]